MPYFSKKLYNLFVMIWLKDIISILYPELLVLLALILAILLSTSKNKSLIWLTSLILLLSGLVHIVKTQLPLKEPIQILSGMFIADNLSIVFRTLILLISILVILGSVKYSEGFTHKSEFMIVLLSAILGAMFLAGANDLITLFVALETMGLSSILLVGYSKYDLRSNEASLKYLLNSASASAIFLFGLSILYGICGSTHFYEIKYKLLQQSLNGNLNISIISVMIVLIIGGLAFKLGGAPMHMWSPDVYEGAPTPVTAFLSIISKSAGLVISIRILFNLFDFAVNSWQPIIVIISILSMIIGNFVALSEVISKASIKRLMAYSSIAQIGYILSGLALAKPETVSASIFYMIVYSIMNIGAFLCIIGFGNEANSDNISDYAGLAKKRPLLAFAFAICLFNLAGLPVPPAGFIAKFILFKVSFSAGSLGVILGSIGLVTTILSIYYYSFVAKLMIVDEPSEAVLKIDSNPLALGASKELNTAISFALAGIFALVFVSSSILKYSDKTANGLASIEHIISYKK